MMTLQIGVLGERLDLSIRQGATFGPFLAQMFDPDGTTPINLTGCTITAQIRKRAADRKIAATLAVPITDAVNGRYEFVLTAEQTAAIPAGESPASPASRYVWDMELHHTGGVLPLYYGDVIVLREVTRA